MLQIGCGAGFARDRTDAALPVVQTMLARGGPAVLIFEMLAERTLAFAQLERRADPTRGYSRDLEPMLAPVLGLCLEHGVTIVTNAGAANPLGAAQRVRALAAGRGYPDARVGVVLGDDLSALNFVIDDALEGGVNASLGLDRHGKTLSFLLLSIPIEVPAAWAESLLGPANAASARRQGG